MACQMINKIIGRFLVVACTLLVASCEKPPGAIPVKGISLNVSSLEMTEGDTADLIATVSPWDADNQTVIWSSDNGSVAGVSSIGHLAFKGCTGLSSITILSDTPPAGASTMFDDTNDIPIYVPAGSVDAYKAADGWNRYADRIQASH